MIEWIKNLRSTDRGKAVFKLFLYMIFLGFVMIILLIGGAFNRQTTENDKESSSSNQMKESTKELSFREKQNKILKGNYNFKYTITGEQNILFEGEVKDGIEVGYKETEDSLIKYEIENGIVYRTFLTTKEKYEYLYTYLDERLFNFETLFDTLNQTNSTIEKNETNKIYRYTNLFDTYNLEVTTNNKEITKINIKNNVLEYNFEFEY